MIPRCVFFDRNTSIVRGDARCHEEQEGGRGAFKSWSGYHDDREAFPNIQTHMVERSAKIKGSLTSVVSFGVLFEVRNLKFPVNFHPTSNHSDHSNFTIAPDLALRTGKFTIYFCQG